MLRQANLQDWDKKKILRKRSSMFINWIKELFTTKTQQQLEEEWLAKSDNLVELEWRQRQLNQRFTSQKWI